MMEDEIINLCKERKLPILYYQEMERIIITIIEHKSSKTIRQVQSKTSSKKLDFQSPWHHFQVVRLFG